MDSSFNWVNVGNAYDFCGVSVTPYINSDVVYQFQSGDKKFTADKTMLKVTFSDHTVKYFKGDDIMNLYMSAGK